MGKVLLPKELIPRASQHGSRGISCVSLGELSAEGNFSTALNVPTLRLQFPVVWRSTELQQILLLSGEKRLCSGTGRCGPALGSPWYIHSPGWRAARAPASILQTHEPGNFGS